MSPVSKLTSAEIAVSVLLFTGRVEGRVLNYGVLPPAAGPGRLALLREAGREELVQAKRLYSRSRDAEGCFSGHPLQSPRAPWWFYPPFTATWPTCRPKSRAEQDESLGRAALNRAVNALNLLEDLDEEEDAHRLVHEIGAFVSWHFGCRINFSDGHWRWHCPATFSHLRMGYSVGFTAVRYCSICNEDMSRCEHMPNRLYTVRVADVGQCPCGESPNCRHNEGDVLELRPHAVVKDADLHEVSLVARPRDPLARISAVSFDNQKMTTLAGREIPSGTIESECLHCRQSCTGMWREDAFVSLLAAM